MRVLLALAIGLAAAAPAWAENTIASDAMKAAQQPTPEMDNLKAQVHADGIAARVQSANAWAAATAPSQAAMQAQVNTWRIDGSNALPLTDISSLLNPRH